MMQEFTVTEQGPLFFIWIYHNYLVSFWSYASLSFCCHPTIFINLCI